MTPSSVVQVKHQKDGAIHRDLDKLEKFTHENCMRLNKTKCKVLHQGWGNTQYQSRLRDEQIKSTPTEKDVRVLVDERLYMQRDLNNLENWPIPNHIEFNKGTAMWLQRPHGHHHLGVARGELCLPGCPSQLHHEQKGRGSSSGFSFLAPHMKRSIEWHWRCSSQHRPCGHGGDRMASSGNRVSDSLMLNLDEINFSVVRDTAEIFELTKFVSSGTLEQ
ncbi:hypothetical protein DUI87_02732 [Hirundo rustica rustica]|uniref:Reverse transcriptase domain-containing protein n=1 Tax=Hirundo rustica rustica TaxID=333673 RepID=A0A3M0L9S8_HIRRU|nr:hypothetical protein DUI87_02732 [Hirundo rustica rustica]